MEKIRFSREEHIYVFAGGKQKLRFKGSINMVTIEDRYLVQFNNSIVVHNHPGGSAFSRQDIESVVAANVKKFILVTEQYIYEVERPATRWPIDFDSSETNEKWEESIALAENLIMKLISSNELALYDSGAAKLHYIWSSFFALNGLRYARKEYKTG